jgi:hypothetical protein
MQNDESILKSTFIKELIHFQMHHEQEKEVIVKQTKIEMSEANNSQIKLLKAEFEQQLNQIKERVEN